MPEIIFKKRRGEIVDLFAVLCMYSISPSLSPILKAYRITVDPYLVYSYDSLCSQIDKNAKSLRPFFSKKDGNVLDGSIFHKMSQMILAREDLLMPDIIDFFRKMGPDMFLAEMFRIMDGKPESAKYEYIKIVNDDALTRAFLARLNCTVRERYAISAFRKYKEYEFDKFITFLEKFHQAVREEHSLNRDNIMRYTDWLQYRLNPKHPEFIFNNPGILVDDYLSYSKIIVTVSLFPPYSCNAVTKDDTVVVSFGVGAYLPYANKCYKKQSNIRDNACDMRDNIMRVLVDTPMRLMEIAYNLSTSSADIKYHMGILEKNGFIKRIRINNLEHFALSQSGIEFIKDRPITECVDTVI